MQQKQEIVYQIKDNQYLRNLRLSNDYSIMLANQRNVQLSYTRCHAILRDGEKDKVIRPIKQVYHPLIVKQSYTKTSTSLPAKTDKLKDSQTTIITSQDNHIYQNQYINYKSQRLKPLKFLAKSNYLPQYQKQENQEIKNRQSLFDSLIKQQSIYEYPNKSQNAKQDDISRSFDQHAQGCLKKLVIKGIREAEQFDVSFEQLSNEENSNNESRFIKEQVIRKNQRNLFINLPNNPQTTKLHQTPHFEEKQSGSLYFSKNYETLSPLKNKQSTMIRPQAKILWNSSIIQKSSSKFNLKNQQSEDDKLSVSSKKSNHIVVKSTCKIYKANQNQHFEKRQQKNQDNKIKFRNKIFDNFDFNDVMQKESLKKVNKHLRNQSECTQVNEKQQKYGNTNQLYYVERQDDKQRVFLPINSKYYCEDFTQQNLANKKQTNNFQHIFNGNYGQNNKANYKQRSSVRINLSNDDIEDAVFYKNQLKKALKRQQELIDLYNREQKRSQYMQNRVNQLNKTVFQLSCRVKQQH